MVNPELKELFFTHHLHKEIEIEVYPDSGNPLYKIKNDQIVSESMELTESLCSDGELKFGSCEASCFKIRVANISIPIMQDNCIKVRINIETSPGSQTYKPLNLGTYKVNSERPTADRKWRDIVAYDFMYEIIKADVLEWYENFFNSHPTGTTLKTFRTEFITQCFPYSKYRYLFPLAAASEKLPLDDLSVYKIDGIKKLSGKDVLSAIGEINGCFPHINRDGYLTYVFLKQDIHGLYPKNTLYPSNNLYPKDSGTTSLTSSSGTYKSADYEDYEVEKIGLLELKDTTKSYTNFAEAGLGNPNFKYTIENNLFILGYSNELMKRYIAQPLSSVIKNIYYRPFEAVTQGNPCFEVGDAISLSTRYQLIESYIMTRTLKGIQELEDTFAAEGPAGEYSITNVSEIQIETPIENIEKQTEENKNKIEETKKEIETQRSEIEALREYYEEQIKMLNEENEKLLASLQHFMQSPDAEGNYPQDKATIDVILEVNEAVRCHNVRPLTDNIYTCGTPNYKWQQIYSAKDTISTSDENEKHDIKPISSKYEELFFKLQPLTYMFNNGDRVHIGTTAQKLKEAMEEIGLSNIEVGAFCRDEVPNEKEQYIYGIRYNEFIMLNTHMIQKLYRQVNEQNEKINELKEMISELHTAYKGGEENGIQ